MTIRIVDLETEGTDPTIHRVVEIASVDVEKPYGQLLCPQKSLVNPGAGRPMPPDAQGVHHISAAMLVNAPPLEVIQKTILTQYPFPDKLAAFAAHNAAFEMSFLRSFTGDTPWLCTQKVAARLWPDAPNLKNQTLRFYLSLDIPDRYTDANPHRALPDAVVTACILQHIIRNQLASISDMLQWSQEPLLMARCPIGWDGVPGPIPWPEVKMECLRWIMNKPTMPPDTQWNAQRELDRRREQQRIADTPWVPGPLTLSLPPDEGSLAAPIPMPPAEPPPSPLPTPFPPPIPRPRPPAPPPVLTGGQKDDLVKFVDEDAPLEQLLPTPAMREGYLSLARGVIAEAKSVPDLEGWFRNARDVGMPAAGILQNSAEYNEIVMLCRAHKLRLQLAKGGTPHPASP